MCNSVFRKELDLFQKPNTDVNTNAYGSLNDSDTTIESEDDNLIVDHKNCIEFAIFSSRTEYEELLITKEFNRRDTSRKKVYTRTCLRLEPGKWEDWITKQIWKVTKLPCGFNYRNHYITENVAAGTMEGKC